MTGAMKAVLLTLGSVLLTGGVLMNAYYQKKQFYPSVVYLTKSSPSMAVLYLQAFVVVIIMGKFMRKIFFGQLRAAEMEHLIERSWYAITETCLAFTVFRDDFSPRFVALFTILLFLKSFHWLAEDRIDYMERSPQISTLFHIRAVSLMTLLALLDAHFINHAYHNTLIKGPSVQLVFGFEYAVLLTAVVHVFVKYVLHTVDLQSDNPWENKAVYLLYTEVILGGVKVAFYFLFLAIMIKVHTFPLFIIRPMYLTVREFKKALNDVVMSRRAIRNMNTLYPDATAEELAASDNVCIICREEMHTMCKKLPCNHIFHTSCLRSWFQRQQTCPTCRMDVLRLPGTQAANQNQVPPAAPVQQPAAAPMPGQMPFQPFQGLFPMVPPNFAAVPQQQQPPQTPPTSTATPMPGAGVSFPSSPGFFPAGGVFSANFGTPNPYMFPFSFPPMPPPNFTGLSAEELRNMAGNEPQHVEARMQCLRDIQTLLNVALLQLNQYMGVAGSLVSERRDTTAANQQEDTGTSSFVLPENAVNTSSTVEQVQSSSIDNTAAAGDVEGACALPKDEVVANLAVGKNHEEEDSSELSEIRKRRLQHFSSSNLSDLDKSE